MTPYRPLVYLAGPVQHADDGGHGWRETIEEQYGEQFDFLNPLDKYDTPTDEVEWLQPGEEVEDYPDAEEVLTPSDIVDADKEMIDMADAILIGLQSVVPMYGTPREHEYAVQTDTDVVVWYEEGAELSPWTIEGGAFLSTEVAECMEHIYVEKAKDGIKNDVARTIVENL